MFDLLTVMSHAPLLRQPVTAVHRTPIRGTLRSSLSRRLDRMEDAELVTRQHTPQPDDRRAVSVSLTAEGRGVWRDANITYRRVVQEQFAKRLTETDLGALQRVFGKLS